VRVLITGAGGLIGSQAVDYFRAQGHEIHGIDNNTRMYLFGPEGDVSPTINRLMSHSTYTHHSIDIRDRDSVMWCFYRVKPNVVIHCAAQPSHDRASSMPLEDFDINAVGTLNLLEAARQLHDDDVVFVHMSTNKVYGDGPNRLRLVEGVTRYDYDELEFVNGIKEDFPVDDCLHSIFGASKLATDVMAQEYGRYYGMNVGIFRGGCLTGAAHAGVELHGFLAYVVKCAMIGRKYTIFGYKGKQVRDQIHASDVVSAIDAFVRSPRKGEVYNIGGGRPNSASILEVIDLIADVSGRQLDYELSPDARIGDHICYITDMSKFHQHFPEWKPEVSLRDMIIEMVQFHEKGSRVV